MQNDNVLVSVIVPVYNAAETLRRCMDAIANQTFKNFEVICINDGSTDNSYEILKEYAEKYNFFRVFTQENCGVAKTRYNAMAMAKGEFLMFCDADDWYELDMVETMYNTIIEKNVDLAVCDTKVYFNDPNDNLIVAKKQYHKIKKVGYAEFTYYNMITNYILWNKIFRKSIIDKYNIEYAQNYEHDDGMFVMKYCLCAKTYYGLDKILYHYITGNKNSLMGKIYANTNTSSSYDFILAWANLHNFIIKQNFSDQVKEFYVMEQLLNNKHFYEVLTLKEQKGALNCYKQFIKENPILLINDVFKQIYEANSFEEFDKIMKSKIRTKTSFLEQIFSIRNEHKHKVLKILGMKLKFPRKVKI